jgi:hypothetical protein
LGLGLGVGVRHGRGVWRVMHGYVITATVWGRELRMCMRMRMRMCLCT